MLVTKSIYIFNEDTSNNLHNNTRSRRPTTVHSNDTLVDTPFQLISGFFHVNQGILCSEHAEQASSRGVLERGGGGGGQQACYIKEGEQQASWLSS